nr:putative ribonuclease H-like domain-containing protein [Tanacetum cinerariifolium]
MDQQYPTVAKIPMLDTGTFEQWQFRMQQYLQHEHYALWEVIEFGDSYKALENNPSTMTTTTTTTSTTSGDKLGRMVTLTTEDMQRKKNDVKSRTTLLLSLPDEHQLRFRDEGYFLGYSMSSKAFRIFNKRTKRVEENVHIEFLENKAIEKGSGPNRLFDIDSLTKSMNYVSVVDAGTKVDASKDVKKDVSSLRYIVLPNWGHEEQLESTSSQSQDDQLETLTVETPIPTASLPIPTVCFSDSQEPSSATRLISKRVTNHEEIPSLENILTFTNQFEDILGDTSNSKESDGVEADVSYMETTITASPTPTLRIHRDHPKSQIIGPVDNLIQTRNKSKEVGEQSFIAIIHQKTDLALLQICLFSCFISQLETKKGYNRSDSFYQKAKAKLHSCTSLCGWHQVTPKECHLHAVKRIFRYLKGHPKLGLWYPKDSPFDLVAYSDSDYGGASQDRKLTSKGCQFLGRRLISWECKKQTIVATSTTEAEYVTAASCCGQVLWIQNQLLDYGYNFMNTNIYIDNNSALYIVRNPVYHSKTKHIEIRRHFIRDYFEKKLINVDHIHTDENVSDLLTKSFDAGRFQLGRSCETLSKEISTSILRLLHTAKTLDLVWIWLGGDYGNVFLNGFYWDSVANMCKNYLHGSDSEQMTHEFIHIYPTSASVLHTAKTLDLVWIWLGGDYRNVFLNGFY